MSQFKSTLKSDGGVLKLAFEGMIDEDVAFPQVELKDYKAIHLDLQGIKAINSVGIREWLDWIRPLSEKLQIHLFNCPKTIVFQFNMVEGFLPPKSLVESFYVPFFCEKCDREENVLVKPGREVTAVGNSIKIDFGGKPPAKCDKPQCELEMDVTEGKYFQFLKRV